MNKKLQWIADIDTSKTNIMKIVQILVASKSGKYILGEGKSKDNPYTVGIYFGGILPDGKAAQSCIIGYSNN
jgi:hypothetical protein